MKISNAQIDLRDFLENRSRVIELAAYFDRISPNPRLDSIRKALELLLKLDGNRTLEIQKIMSNGECLDRCC